jgi:hypothetical protein
MRLIKMLGLAVIAALAAMALIGAPSASAESTALCKAHESPCAEKNTFPAGTTILLSFLEGILETELGNVECEGAHAQGKTVNKLGSPLEIKIESASTEGCGTCSVTISTLGTLLLLKTASNLAEVTVHGVLAKASCAGILNCNYVSELVKLHASGLNAGTPAMLNVSKLEVKSEGGILCPAKATKTALVNMTANGENFYISS